MSNIRCDPRISIMCFRNANFVPEAAAHIMATILYIEYWKQANLPAYRPDIRISGRFALYLNVSLTKGDCYEENSQCKNRVRTI